MESGHHAPACTDNFQVAAFVFDGREWLSCEQCYQVLVHTTPCPFASNNPIILHRHSRASTPLTLRPFAAFKSSRSKVTAITVGAVGRRVRSIRCSCVRIGTL